MDGEFAGLDGPNPAMRADDDFLADDEVRDRAFQVHLVGRDPVRPELAAAAEEPGGSADVHLRPVDRGHAHVPAELDVDLAALQGPAKLPTAGEFDCTAMLTGQLNSIGFTFTLPPNTCTATGATSTGRFELRSAQGENEIRGTYIDNWFVPAVGFVGQATASIEG